jgi:hypothetical protein
MRLLVDFDCSDRQRRIRCCTDPNGGEWASSTAAAPVHPATKSDASLPSSSYRRRASAEAGQRLIAASERSPRRWAPIPVATDRNRGSVACCESS